MLNLVKLIVWVLVLSSPAYAQVSHGGGGSGGETTRLATFQDAATADGDGTAYITRGYDTLGLDITITNTATVTVQGRSASDGTYRNVVCYNRTTPTFSATATASANFQCAVSGLLHVKVPISGCSSCTVTVKGHLTTAASMAGMLVSINQMSVTLAGEDTVNDVQKVEQRFAYQNVTGDLSVKSGVGFLHTITCSSDAAATAGTIIVYDNTAESGTIIWTWTISAVEYQPRTLVFDVAFSTGLYVGYTTTADVTCTVSYR